MNKEKTRGKRREKGAENNIWSGSDWEFPRINVRHQTTDPGRSDNIKQDNNQQKLNIGMSYSNFKQFKDKEKIMREARGKNTSPIIGNKSFLALCQGCAPTCTELLSKDMELVPGNLCQIISWLIK